MTKLSDHGVAAVALCAGSVLIGLCIGGMVTNWDKAAEWMSATGAWLTTLVAVVSVVFIYREFRATQDDGAKRDIVTITNARHLPRRIRTEMRAYLTALDRPYTEIEQLIEGAQIGYRDLCNLAPLHLPPNPLADDLRLAITGQALAERLAGPHKGCETLAERLSAVTKIEASDTQGKERALIACQRSFKRKEALLEDARIEVRALIETATLYIAALDEAELRITAQLVGHKSKRAE
ncbi:hypothetical protein [Pannonibacter tanglangensis]|uniref:5-bromo-4-chloroindolyl phosphate hydrolysis protein n=1 Tax=Pannonibacter tanglangensis TaxID=2750084 RepID=A0ABW9ZFH2_9HYPH|nr:hypothetical protein [Pannonibacter sp. XCT-34]NBN62803.1 hypothetical protein [Pannonibacter sp. XCT-34]